MINKYSNRFKTELSTTLKNVTTETVSHYSQSRAVAASSLHIVTSEEICQYGYHNLGEVLRRLSNFILKRPQLLLFRCARF